MADHAQTKTLGLEGGGTRTTVLLVDHDNNVLASFATGPANLRLMQPGDLVAHLQAIKSKLPSPPDQIGIGLAGVRLAADHDRLRSAVNRVWPTVPCATSDDLVTAFEAIEWLDDCESQVLVLSGTGSCISGRRRDGSTTKLGGRGHVLGDRASACDIAQQALRAVMSEHDLEMRWPPLGADILAHLQMNEPEDLIDWSLVATKGELAGVALPVFEAARSRKDPLACKLLQEAAQKLAKDGAACADRITKPGEKVQFIFNGAVLTKNPEFSRTVAEMLVELRKPAEITPLTRPSVWGAIANARSSAHWGPFEGLPADQEEPETISDTEISKPAVSAAPTEQRNPRSEHLSELSIVEGLGIMLAEDATITEAIAAETQPIAWTVETVVEAFSKGGRLIYTGAGTSGRLGVLDASECPPTFSVPPEQVQGIIAGGRTALWSAVEGAEDDAGAGRLAIAMRRVSEKDVVVGISASGYAPFVWGTLQEANERGATTVLLCCNPAYRDHEVPDRVIAANTGPEVLTGSTRLKAGTATKLILNMITTLAMTHSGKVLGNYMVDLNPSNHKLRGRAARIVSAITGKSLDEAKVALEKKGWSVRAACTFLAHGSEVQLDGPTQAE